MLYLVIKNMENKIENKENKILTVRQFEELWNEAKGYHDGYNMILERNETEIRADDFRYDYGEGENTMIVLYYKGDIIAFIRLKEIKMVY